MNAATMRMRDPTRDRFVGAARPHTPRLHSPPLWADATREPPPRGNPASLRTRNKENLTNGSGTTIGQLYVKRYSLRPGGSIFDAHLAHNWVTVSTSGWNRALRHEAWEGRMSHVDRSETFRWNPTGSKPVR